MSTGEHAGGRPASAEAFSLARTYIERFFTAADLMTDASAVRVISPESDCGEVSAYLTENGYDIAVSSVGGAALGYVTLESIEGKDCPVSPYITTIRPEETITPAATVMDVIDGLCRSDYLFVIEKRDDFRGLVTYADLGKPPVRAVCFIAIIRRTYGSSVCPMEARRRSFRRTGPGSRLPAMARRMISNAAWIRSSAGAGRNEP